jgi:hypothetical protein
MKNLLKMLLLLPILLIPSCKKDSAPVEPEPPVTGGRISTGPSTEVARQVISTAGGTLRVSMPGDPLDGFELTVPQNAFAQSQDFAVSRAEIVSHQLGEYFNPVSPLIKISYGGGYADELMEVRIPIALPAGHFAMGFFYDEATGELEGIPVVGLDSTSITISTRHFSPPDGGGGGLFRRSQGVWRNLVISSILRTVLEQQPVITTGFSPGADDWEFPNYGSYVAPGGHCAGQSMAAMWYFYEKKLKGEPSLYHRFDTIHDPAKSASFWFDNPLGYRFASTIQRDLDFTGWVEKLNQLSVLPYLSWRSFIYAMLLLGEPQFVIIKKSGTSQGHAMIVYAISPVEGKLHIADPNYPHNRVPGTGDPSVRTIQYHWDLGNGRFDPYSSAATAGGAGTDYDQIGYAAKTSHIEWPQLAKRWKEVQDSTIGDDRFPAYTLWVHEGAGFELSDGLITQVDSLVLHCRSTACVKFIAGTDHLQEFRVYTAKGLFLGEANGFTNGLLTLHLFPGEERIGIRVKGRTNMDMDAYVDFKWFTIRHHIPVDLVAADPSGKPITTPGVKGTPYVFKAQSGGLVPPAGKAKYTWDFGDGTPAVTVTDDSTISHAFAQDRTYNIRVVLREDTVTWGEGSAQATISPVTGPIISAVTPSTARINDTLTVQGTNFGNTRGQGRVFFAGKYGDIEAGEIPSWSDNQIQVRIPRATDSGYVSVEVDAIRSNRFAFTLDRSPWIDSLWSGAAYRRQWGLPGKGITLGGRNFWFGETTPPRVRFNGIEIDANSWMWQSIGATIPDGISGPVDVTAISSAGFVSNSRGFFVGVPFDTLKARPQARVAIRLSSTYYDTERGLGVRGTFGHYQKTVVDVSWDTSGFTVDMKDLDENKEGTLTVTFPSHSMHVATLELAYVSHETPYEDIQYKAENIDYQLITLVGQGELLMEFYAEGYDKVKSVTTEFSGTVAPAQVVYELEGLDPEAMSLISITIIDLDVR